MALKDLLGITIVDDPWDSVPMPRFQSGPIALRGMRFDLLHCEWDGYGINLRVSVPDRDTDAPVEIKFKAAWPEPPRNPQHLADMIERGIAWMVAHEIAERMLIAGARQDPHYRSYQGPPPRLPLRVHPALGMQPFGAHEPADEVAILTRVEVVQAIEEHHTERDLPMAVWAELPDELLRAMLRGLRAKAASTNP